MPEKGRSEPGPARRGGAPEGDGAGV